MELSQFIASLLRHHDCVIVPNFGGFIANYKSAVIDTTRNQIYPPTKSILFNANLTNNDGLLGNYVAKERVTGYPEALNFIQQQVLIWEEQIENGQRIEIEEIGFIYKENNRLVFEQSRDVNLLLSAYGLSSVNFVPFVQQEQVVEENKIIQEVPVKQVHTSHQTAQQTTPVIALNTEEKEAIAEKKESENHVTEHNEREESTWRPRLKYLAVAAAVPLFFYAYWIPMQTDFLDTGKVQMADFNPLNRGVKKSYEPRLKSPSFDTEEVRQPSWKELTENVRENVTVYNYQFDDQTFIPVKLIRENQPANLPLTDALSTQAPFQLIRGCFSVKENAESLVGTLQSEGVNASILDYHKGLYRVTAGGFTSYDSANQELSHLKQEGISAWVLKK
jgi:hypothetical protein